MAPEGVLFDKVKSMTTEVGFAIGVQFSWNVVTLAKVEVRFWGEEIRPLFIRLPEVSQLKVFCFPSASVYSIRLPEQLIMFWALWISRSMTEIT